MFCHHGRSPVTRDRQVTAAPIGLQDEKKKMLITIPMREIKEVEEIISIDDMTIEM